MKYLATHSLKAYNSFSVESSTSSIYAIKSVTDLHNLPDLSIMPFYILGEGSNTLFIDDIAPTIIKMNIRGIEVTETDTSYVIKVAAGENWHHLVSYCLEQHIYGLENLALIPGSVGAAPVQNIGAYGVEFSNLCQSVEWFDFTLQTVKSISNTECGFGYRESIFKHSLKNKGIITAINLCLPKQWVANLSYQGLSELNSSASGEQVFEKVIALRRSKLPDPNVVPNAGSFFKNPIVESDFYLALKKKYENIPSYPQENGQVKLAAGWLIEETGLKGYRQNNVGVHNKQALVLVNYDEGSGSDIIKLAAYVQQQVFEKFNIKLDPEVRMVNESGEISFSAVITDTHQT